MSRQPIIHDNLHPSTEMPEVESEYPGIPAVLEALVSGNDTSEEFPMIGTRQAGNGRHHPAITWEVELHVNYRDNIGL